MSPKAKAENVTLRDEERQPCEVWTRVMGYHRPVSEFNLGKKSEFATRKWFSTDNATRSGETLCRTVGLKK